MNPSGGPQPYISSTTPSSSGMIQRGLLILRGHVLPVGLAAIVLLGGAATFVAMHSSHSPKKTNGSSQVATSNAADTTTPKSATQPTSTTAPPTAAPAAGTAGTKTTTTKTSSSSAGSSSSSGGGSSSSGGGGSTAPKGCAVSTHNVPDGPDPWGGCFPGSSNTGVPAGTTLTNYTGPMIITTNNTVIDSKNITGDLRIRAANVVVKNSKVFGDVRIDAGDEGKGYYLTVQDTEVNAGDYAGDNAYDGTAIGAVDFTATRVNTHGGKLGINCFMHCTVQDSYLHGVEPDYTGVTHMGAIRVGEEGNTLHDTLSCDSDDTGDCSGDYTGYGDFGPVQNDLIQHNLMVASDAGYCAYGGASGGKPYSNDSNHVQFIENVFQRGTRKGDHGVYICATYAAAADYDETAPGNVFTGNIYDDGTPVHVNSPTG